MEKTLRFLDKEITVKNLTLVIKEAPVITISASDLADNYQSVVRGLETETSDSPCVALYKHEGKYLVLMGLKQVLQQSSSGQIAGYFVSKQLLKRVVTMDHARDTMVDLLTPVQPQAAREDSKRPKPFQPARQYQGNYRGPMGRRADSR